jgi:hypothetical protein
MRAAALRFRRRTGEECSSGGASDADGLAIARYMMLLPSDGHSRRQAGLESSAASALLRIRAGQKKLDFRERIRRSSAKERALPILRKGGTSYQCNSPYSCIRSIRGNEVRSGSLEVRSRTCVPRLKGRLFAHCLQSNDALSRSWSICQLTSFKNARVLPFGPRTGGCSAIENPGERHCFS